MARAMASRWFCPSDSEPPRSRSGQSQPARAGRGRNPRRRRRAARPQGLLRGVRPHKAERLGHGARRRSRCPAAHRQSSSAWRGRHPAPRRRRSARRCRPSGGAGQAAGRNSVVLPLPDRADDGDHLMRLHLQIQLLQNGRASLIGKLQLLQRQRPAERPRGRAAARAPGGRAAPAAVPART